MTEQPINTDEHTSGTDVSTGMSPRSWGIVALIIVLIAAAGWYLYSVQADDARIGTEGAGQSTADGNETVARVNGEALTRAGYERALSQTEAALTQQGVPTQTPAAQEELQGRAMDTLVSQTLILQAAGTENITAEAAEIDEQFATVSSQFQNEAAFESALAAQGISKEGFRRQISDQLVIEEYLESKVDFAAVEVSDEEIAEFYTEISAQSDTVPPLEEISDQLEMSLIQQKQQEMVNDVVASLRAESEVEILL